MVTVMKNRTTDVRIFFSDLVDFAIYVMRSGGATILFRACLESGRGVMHLPLGV